MHAYCLFCETGKCEAVAAAAMQRLGCRAISPKQVQHTWFRGKMVDVQHDLLPGYVFLYADGEPLDIACLRGLQGVIRCLCNPDGCFELAGDDERFALMLLHKGGVIGKTPVYQEGQRIQICRGAYEGLETRILKVDHRNARMQIEIPFAQILVKTWVEYEIVSNGEGADAGACGSGPA